MLDFDPTRSPSLRLGLLVDAAWRVAGVALNRAFVALPCDVWDWIGLDIRFVFVD
jgi:hypothetical protein